ncbi:GIDE domain-containing protein [Haladaptatus sp. NG-WS-4]
MVQSLVGSVAVSGVGLVFVLVGLYTMNGGRVERAQSRRITDTETTKIRELNPGTAEVKGTAHLAEDATLVESPITGRDALATSVEMEEWESSGQGGGNWETKHAEQTTVPITVDDGSDEVRVELPANGELNVEEAETTVEAGDEPPEHIKQYVEDEAAIDAATRHEFGPLSTGERRRYSEGVIEPGEGVYVLGTARHDEDADWGERAFVIDEPTESGDFVLSDKSEEELIREGKRGGLVSLVLGGALVVAGIAATVFPWVGA